MIVADGDPRKMSVGICLALSPGGHKEDVGNALCTAVTKQATGASAMC
jgi:hypothetical protein